MDNQVEIYIVIPSYQAKKTIQKVLQDIPVFIHKIVVVDDASTDGTDEIVRSCQKSDPRIVLITHPANQGVGGAVITGYYYALEKKAGIIVKMDSDGQMDPGYIQDLIAPILAGESDYTKGNRFLHEEALLKMPIIRRIGNLGLSFLTKAASGYWNIFDPTNGFTAISFEACNSLKIERLAKRYFFETSILLELGLQKMVVKDIYIPAKYLTGKSRLSTLRSFFEFPPRLLKGLLKRIVYSYFIRDFTAISVFLVAGWINVLFGLIWGIYHWWKSSYYHEPATTGTVMIATLTLIIGMQFLLQAIVMDIQNTPSKRK